MVLIITEDINQFEFNSDDRFLNHEYSFGFDIIRGMGFSKGFGDGYGTELGEGFGSGTGNGYHHEKINKI